MFVHRDFVLQLYHKNLDAAFLASLFAAIATTQSHPTQTSAGPNSKGSRPWSKENYQPKAMTAVRRSGRERKQATSVYDEAAKKKEAEEAEAEQAAAAAAKTRRSSGASASAKKAKASNKRGRGKKKAAEEDEDEAMSDA